MLRVVRPYTYKTRMPRLNSEFYDFEAVEDEAVAGLLSRHIVGLVHRARKTKLLTLAHKHHQPSPTTGTDKRQQVGSGSQWLGKLLSGGRSRVPVFLPEDFLSRVVRDIVRMTEGEDNGVRGCTLCLELWDGSHRVVIGKIKCDPKITSSYTLFVRLVRAPPPSNNLSGGMRFLGNKNEAIYISPGYQLEKTRNLTHS